jgi:hypothetical protein
MVLITHREERPSEEKILKDIKTPIEKTAQEKIRRSPTGERERSLGSWWYKTTFHRWQKLSNTL